MAAVQKISEYVDKGSGLSTTHTTTATLTPTAGLLYLALVPCQGGTTTDVAPTLTGAGITWINVGHVTAGSVSLPRRTDLFVGLGVAGVGGALTATYSAGRRHIGVFVDEWDDVDTNQGTLGVRQVVGAWDQGVQSGSAACTLATFGSALNYAYAGVSINNDVSTRPPSLKFATAWSPLGQHGDGLRRAGTAYHRGPSPGPGATFPTDNWIILGAEIAALPTGAPPPPSVPPGAYTGPYRGEGWTLVLVKNDGTVLSELADAENVTLTPRLSGYAELKCRVPLDSDAILDLDTSSRSIKAYRDGVLMFYGRITEPVVDEANESGDWTHITAADDYYWLKTRLVHNTGNKKTITFHENSGMIAKAIIDTANAGSDVWPDPTIYDTTPPPTLETFVETHPSYIQTGLPSTPTTQTVLATVPGRVYVAVVSNRVNGLDTTPSLSGPISWTLKSSYLTSAYGIRMTVFWGVGNGSQGVVTANYGTGDADGIAIIVDEFAGVNTLTPWVQIASAAGDQNSADDGQPEVSLAAFADATRNAAWAATYNYGHRDNNSTPDSHWHELGNIRSSQQTNIATQYRTGEEREPRFRAHNVRWEIVAAELKWDGAATAITASNKIAEYFGTNATLQYDLEQLRPVADVIAELAGMHNGFFFRMVPIDNNPSKHSAFHAYYPDPGVDNPGARFEYGGGTLANLEGFKREGRFPRQEGYVAQDNGEPTMGSELAAGAAQGDYGYQETVVSPPSWLDKSLHPEFILSQTAPATQYVYTVKPSPGARNLPVPWDDFNLGDVVRITLKRGRVQDHDVSVMVTEFTVSIDNDTGLEVVTDLVLAGLHDDDDVEA